MATPTAPRGIAALDVPLPVVEAQTATAVLAVCHDAEAAHGHWAEAHDTDQQDAGFARLAPGHPDAWRLCGWCSTPTPPDRRHCTRQCAALDNRED